MPQKKSEEKPEQKTTINQIWLRPNKPPDRLNPNDYDAARKWLVADRVTGAILKDIIEACVSQRWIIRLKRDKDGNLVKDSMSGGYVHEKVSIWIKLVPRPADPPVII